MSLTVLSVWAGVALVLHYLLFAVGALNAGRGPAADAFLENLRLYNPFSWDGCVRARMANLRGFITCPKHGVMHDTLGQLFPADLDDPAKQDRIVREAFISRTWFWTSAVLNYAKFLFLTGVVGYAFFRLADFVVLGR